jgi:hypothetical protein
MPPRNTSTNHPKPAAHLAMLEDMVAKGFLKPVGDSYEITAVGHEYTRALTAARPDPSTFEGNEAPDLASHQRFRTWLSRWD